MFESAKIGEIYLNFSIVVIVFSLIEISFISLNKRKLIRYVNFTYQLSWKGNYLYLETDTMTVCYLKLFRSVAFDNFIVQRQTLGFFLEKPLLSDRKFANSIYPHVNEIDAREFFFYHLCIYKNCKNISRRNIFMGGDESVSRIRKKIYRRWKIRVFSLHFCFMHEDIGERLGWHEFRVESRQRLEENRKVFANFPYSVDKQFSFP